LAAAFMRSSARRSFGFSKPYLAHILDGISRVHVIATEPSRVYFVKPLPSTLTTIHVLGSRGSDVSKLRTYSNLRTY
jgi:hypothetical protein